MTTGKMLYEGKAKKIYENKDDVESVILEYKDEATAFNAEKKGVIESKGILNNKISSAIFKELADSGIESHFIEMIDDRRQLCLKTEIIQIEVIVRNIATGSILKRLGLEHGTKFSTPIKEICYKNDELGDPLINDDHAVAMGLCTREELDFIYSSVEKLNTVLCEMFLEKNIVLVDFKVEYGRFGGRVVLSDEISPDTCRLWDKDTMEVLDKDLFRNDLGSLIDGYSNVLNRFE